MKEDFVLKKLDIIPDVLETHFNNLSVDKYLKEDFRYRSFSHFNLANGKINKLAHKHFVQSAEYNPLLAEIERDYQEISDGLVATSDFQTILFSFVELCGIKPEEYEVGVHQIRIIATDKKKGEPSPEGVHKDGFDYVGIFCVSRKNIIGGVTQLFSSKNGEPIYQKTLNPGELLIFNDSKLFHYTTSIETTPGNSQGTRDVLILTLHRTQSHDYTKNYLQAVENPLPKLKETFREELKLLKKFAKDNIVLDVGCGVGRPAKELAEDCKRLVCIDNDIQMLEIAKRELVNLKNIEIIEADAALLPFDDQTFDFVYATYNLLGSVTKSERQKVVSEMARVTKNGGVVLNITWKNDDVASKFLEAYYPSIGIDIVEANKSKTVTTKGTFEKISKADLQKLYENVGIKQTNFVDVGPVWFAIIGVK